MWINGSLKNLDELEGQMLEDFIDSIIESNKFMKEAIKYDLSQGMVELSQGSPTQLNEIIGFYKELNVFFEKLEEYTICAEIKDILDFFERKGKYSLDKS